MKQLDKKGDRNKIGAYGEIIACRYLIKSKFTILDTNYLKPWGEIDVVARGIDQKIHFFEVKAVSYETKYLLQQSVLRATYRPEENVHPKKLQRLHRAIQSWLEENRYDGEWQIDVAAVRLVSRERYATIKIISNVL